MKKRFVFLSVCFSIFLFVIVSGLNTINKETTSTQTITFNTTTPIPITDTLIDIGLKNCKGLCKFAELESYVELNPSDCNEEAEGGCSNSDMVGATCAVKKKKEGGSFIVRLRYSFNYKLDSCVSVPRGDGERETKRRERCYGYSIPEDEDDDSSADTGESSGDGFIEMSSSLIGSVFLRRWPSSYCISYKSERKLDYSSCTRYRKFMSRVPVEDQTFPGGIRTVWKKYKTISCERVLFEKGVAPLKKLIV